MPPSLSPYATGHRISLLGPTHTEHGTSKVRTNSNTHTTLSVTAYAGRTLLVCAWVRASACSWCRTAAYASTGASRTEDQACSHKVRPICSCIPTQRRTAERKESTRSSQVAEARVVGLVLHEHVAYPNADQRDRQRQHQPGERDDHSRLDELVPGRLLKCIEA